MNTDEMLVKLKQQYEKAQAKWKEECNLDKKKPVPKKPDFKKPDVKKPDLKKPDHKKPVSDRDAIRKRIEYCKQKFMECAKKGKGADKCREYYKQKYLYYKKLLETVKYTPKAPKVPQVPKVPKVPTVPRKPTKDFPPKKFTFPCGESKCLLIYLCKMCQQYHKKRPCKR